MMGYQAVKAILDGEQNKVISFRQGRYEMLELEEALNMHKEMDKSIYDVIKILAM